MPARAEGHIVAMGGAGFSMEPNNPLLDDYILSLAGKNHPRICFVPTASGDADSYIQEFVNAFPASRARADVLRLFRRGRRTPEQILSKHDIIYVGGGNTANALAVWRTHGVDALLKRHWQSGRILAGVSAGMICWFQRSITDSFGPLAPLRDGLGFLKGSACPHYDGERNRKPTYHAAITAGLPAGYAADDGAALHFIGTKLHDCISSRPAARVYRVSRTGGRIQDKALPTRYLG